MKKTLSLTLFLLTLFSACAETKVSESDLPKEDESVNRNCFYITVGTTTLTGDFADNSSARAFRNLMENGPVTVEMDDYGSFEKVGDLKTSLPANDRRITTAPGDVILYRGHFITIYYDSNSWDLTLLGRIRNATRAQLLSVLGTGAVTVTFTLSEPVSSVE